MRPSLHRECNHGEGDGRFDVLERGVETLAVRLFTNACPRFLYLQKDMEDEIIKELEEKQKKQKAERNYNFFRPVGQFIEHVDTVNFSMDKDGNFQFENVGQMNGVPPKQMPQVAGHEVEERFHFIHPEIEDEEAWRIHNAIKRLVAYQKVPEICAYLKEQKQKSKLLLPPNPSFVYEELKRLGMPTGDGYGDKYFAACYKE